MTADVLPRSVLEAADRLQRAAEEGRPCSPVRDLIGPDDVRVAYAVQAELTGRRLRAGATMAGRKIGLTSPAVRVQLGVDQPDFGVLFTDMDMSRRAEVPSDRLLQPKAEAEVAFVLGADLDDVPDGPAGIDRVRAAVDHAVAALEICDSRVADWDIRITDTVADNASSGLFVLGERRVTLAEFEPREVTMELIMDGTMLSNGDGSACMGDPLAAVAWLARTAQEFGQPLRAGEIVLSGALGPMVPALPGSTVHAEISTLGMVSATFSTAPDAAGAAG